MLTKSILLKKYQHWDKITRLNNSTSSSFKKYISISPSATLEILSSVINIFKNLIILLISLPMFFLLVLCSPLLYLKERIYKIYGLRLFGINKFADANKFRQWRRIRSNLYEKSNLLD